MEIAKHIRSVMIMTLLSVWAVVADAQEFFNLTAEEVRVDSVLPHFGRSKALTGIYRDSVYTARLVYPEFIDMPEEQVKRYKTMVDELPPAMPIIDQRLVFDRKRPSLDVSFCPVVYRSGRYQLLVSFMLDIESAPVGGHIMMSPQRKADTEPASRYAAHSVLASGRWAKIRVPSTGVYCLSESLVRQAGFSDISKVKIYGYGGNLRSELLTESDLVEHDDLKEVPICIVGGKRLFYALGPVSWSSNTVARRTRNPYSDYGYYFITQSDSEPVTIDEKTFLDSFYPSPYYYHSLYEVDGYSWYHGGRNLFDSKSVPAGSSHSVDLGSNPNAGNGTLSVNVSSGVSTSVQVEFNDSIVGTLRIILSDEYDKGGENTLTCNVYNLSDKNTVKLTTLSGGPARLDYASMAWNEPLSSPDLSAATFPMPEYVYNITNQDLHADGQSDMVIIIPTSQKLRKQAERLKSLHEKTDGMRVRIVPADELYNEFSSGTPDASAYRNYLKMLYDRAETEADMPKYLILFGDCVWDNRMVTTDCRKLNADDYLLCFESENSFNEVKCYVDDGYFCMLDDGEGVTPLYRDKLDVAVGRFPVTTETDAKIMVDKVSAYINNEHAGAWQNTLMFMGDDGNKDMHMSAANEAADMMASKYPGYMIKKVMWDAYLRESSSTGNSYPDASRTIKQQQAAGALIMDYSGHGRADQVSHESVLRLSDFAGFTNANLPLWITASCDIMPFDGMTPTIGETAVLNSKGGAVAFFGTTRTVYALYNRIINNNFLTHVLSTPNGKPQTIGEAQRLAKNNLVTSSPNSDEIVNNLQFSLLGDPAMSLAIPTAKVLIDSINDVDTSSGAMATVGAGSLVTVKGHIEGAGDFDGVMTATVQDTRELVTCKWNNRNENDAASSPFSYYDRTKTLFNGSDSVRNGHFEFTFAVPKDINYTVGTGLITVYAVSNDRSVIAHGCNDSFTLSGSELGGDNGVGPSIYCYLNTPSFVNGGKVNPTPYFVAQVSDKDGINTSGNGIGHDLQLIIDGKMSRTYVLNDNFVYDFGTYTKGSTYYSIPELEEGEHHLLFRAWDVLNNSSTAELTFNVSKSLAPTIYSIGCTENPASTSTTFIINHDFTGSDVTVTIDVFDMSGRHLWSHSENGVSTGGAYTVDWNLTVDGGERLRTGVYLYRVSTSANGDKHTSKAKKLIIIGNK